MENKKKDFFISYTQSDKPWATWIAETLESAGYSVAIMEWDFRPGQLFPVAMDRAVQNCERLIAVLSKAYRESYFSNAEWAAFFAKKGEENIIPVRVEDFEPDGLWAARIYIDLVRKKEEEAKKELLNGVSKKGVPRTGSAFPGDGGSSSAVANLAVRASYPGIAAFTCGLPNRNPHFTGRKEVLETIRETFKSREAIALTQSITGLGGVGKSQIAIEYSYKYGSEYAHIVWVDAETHDTIYASLEAFALDTGIVRKDVKYESADVLKAVHSWMNQNDSWLFVFDNATDVETLKNYLPAQNIGHRHMLITSRYKNCRSIATPLVIEVFSKEEASEFFTKRTGNPHDTFQDDLAEQLGYLSLALEQAAAYICSVGCSYREYLLLLKEYHLDVFREEESQDAITKQSVHATWDISIKKITDESAKQLLNLCAFFAPDRIDFSWFKKAIDCLPQPLQDALPDRLRFNKIKAELTKYSLVEIREEKLSLHRLVQEVIKDKLKGEQSVWLNYCVLMLNQCINYDFSTSENRELFTELVPHLQSAAEQIPPDAQTAEIEGLYHFLGYGYDQFADYSQALEWYRKALAIRERVLGKSHSDTATIYNNIAGVYYNQGEYEKTLEWNLKALAIREKVLGKSHPDMATTYNNIAAVYNAQGEYEKALEWYRKALDIYEKVLGALHPSTATIYDNIAVTYDKQGEYEKALEWHRKALDTREKVLGASHPVTANTYNNIAGVYEDKGKYEKALEWYRKALAIREEVLGASHPDTAATYNNIADVYGCQSEYEEALKCYWKALDIREKVLGFSHPDTTATYNNIATVYYNKGEYDKALEWYQKALTNSEKVLGKSHSNRATTYTNIAAVYAKQGKYEKALEWNQKALTIREKILGKSHPDVANIYNNIAFIYVNQGEYEKALEWYAKALPVFVNVLGLNHPNTKIVIKSIAITYKAAGNPKPFEEWLLDVANKNVE